MEAEIAEVTLVVMETGSAWPIWAERRLPATSTRVIVQQPDESPAALASRVVDRVEGLVARGHVFGSTIVACGERADSAVMRMRSEVARSILSAYAAGGSAGRVVFAAGQRSNGHARHALAALVGDLLHEWEDTGAVIKLRFGTHAARPQDAARVA